MRGRSAVTIGELRQREVGFIPFVPPKPRLYILNSAAERSEVALKNLNMRIFSLTQAISPPKSDLNT